LLHIGVAVIRIGSRENELAAPGLRH
jgi:hypothetical protein